MAGCRHASIAVAGTRNRWSIFAETSWLSLQAVLVGPFCLADTVVQLLPGQLGQRWGNYQHHSLHLGHEKASGNLYDKSSSSSTRWFFVFFYNIFSTGSCMSSSDPIIANTLFHCVDTDNFKDWWTCPRVFCVVSSSFWWTDPKEEITMEKSQHIQVERLRDAGMWRLHWKVFLPGWNKRYLH